MHDGIEHSANLVALSARNAMLFVCRIMPPDKGLTVTVSLPHHARREKMHVKAGRRRRPTPPWSIISGMRSAVEAGTEVKKCLLTVIGEVSSLAAWIQDEAPAYSAPS